jgi:PAS domain S-box-containing protein
VDYAHLVERAGDIIYAVDRHGRFLYYNAAVTRILGYGPTERIGHHFSEIMTPRSAAVARKHFRQGLKGCEPTPFFRVDAIAKDGHIVQLEIIATTMYRNGKIVGRQGIARDTSEIKRLRGEVAEKAERVAVLEERNRIARELHDSIAQKLFTLALELEWCKQQLPRNCELSERLSALKAMAREGAKEVRKAIFNLSQDGVGSQGLVRALQQLVQRFRKASALSCSLSICGSPKRLPAAVENAVYRACQECLFNVLKHARATTVHLRCRFGKGKLSAEVADDGIGRAAQLNRKSQKDKERFGLKNVTWLIEQAGGRLRILNNRPRGIKITMQVPLPG